MIVAAQLLAQEEFGRFGVVVTTITTFSMLCGLGLGLSATKYVAEHLRTTPSAARALANGFLALGLTLGIAAAAGGLLLSSKAAEWIFGSPDLHAILLAGIPALVANLLRGIQSGILLGMEEHRLSAQLNLIEGSITAVAIVALTFVFGLIGAVAALAVGGIVAVALGHAYIRRIIAVLPRGDGPSGVAHLLRDVSRFTLTNFFAHSAAAPALWIAILWAAQEDDGLRAVAEYTAAYQWHGPVVMVLGLVIASAFPVFAEKAKRGHLQEMRKLRLTMLAGLSAAGACIAIPALFLAEPLMRLYGPTYVDAAAPFRWVILAAILHVVCRLHVMNLLSLGRSTQSFIAHCGWALLLPSLSLVFRPFGVAESLAMSLFFAYATKAALTLAMLIRIERSI